MKYFILFLTAAIIFFKPFIAESQDQTNRDPDNRRDYANVFYKPKYALFDYWTDEPIYPNQSGEYSIYYASNENKIPKLFKGTANELAALKKYKFKNFENCSNWCNGVKYQDSDAVKKSINSRTPIISNEGTQGMQAKKNSNSALVPIREPINEFSCETCREAVEAYVTGYFNKVTFSESEFFIVKEIVEKCMQQFADLNSKNDVFKSCIKSFEEKLLVLLGRTNRGPSSSGEDSYWRLKGPVGVRDLAKFGPNFDTSWLNYNINIEQVIAEFKNTLNDQPILGCDKCAKQIKNLFNSFKSQSSLPDSVITKWRIDVERCMDGLPANCFEKEELSMIKILSGRESGGPSSSGEDSKWRLSGYYAKLKKENSNQAFESQPPFNGNIIFTKESVNGQFLSGVMDKNKIIVIPPKFSHIENFNLSSGVFYAANPLGSNLVGLINSFGDTVKPFIYRSLFTPSDSNLKKYSCSIIQYSTRGSAGEPRESGFFDSNLEAIWPPPSWKSQGNREVGLFIKGFSNVDGRPSNIMSFRSRTMSGKWGFVDTLGKLILEPKYEHVEPLSINKNSYSGRILFLVYKDTLVGIFGSKSGNEYEELIKPVLNQVNQINQTLIFSYRKGSFFGLLDLKDCAILCDPIYEGIKKLDDNTDSYFLALKNKRVLLISKNGTQIGNFDFEPSSQFSRFQNLILVRQNNLEGLIDFSGNEIIPIRYNRIELTNNGLVKVNSNKRYGLYDINGKPLTQVVYENIDDYSGPTALAKLNGKWGMLNQNGSLILAAKYDDRFVFISGIANVRSNGVSYKIDESGNRVLNNFNNYSLRSIPWSNSNMYDEVRLRMRSMYDDIMKGLFVDAMFSGTSAEKTLQKINSQKAKLKSDVIGWLGGNLTQQQLAEFNEISLSASKEFNQSIAVLNMATLDRESSNSSVKPRYGDVSTNNYNIPLNAWQCSKCGVLSKGKQQPNRYDNGNCTIGSTHTYGEANTTQGYQCKKCGRKYYLLNKGRGETGPCCGEFGNCSKGTNHDWRAF
jgi:ribosomal protein L37E